MILVGWIKSHNKRNSRSRVHAFFLFVMSGSESVSETRSSVTHTDTAASLSRSNSIVESSGTIGSESSSEVDQSPISVSEASSGEAGSETPSEELVERSSELPAEPKSESASRSPESSVANNEGASTSDDSDGIRKSNVLCNTLEDPLTFEPFVRFRSC